ncbi:methyltransferase type 11 [Aphanothece hegewaldii CCALA 016]|uniref:Methyltransferase type 11 n=1 Tax=Aphanothece hegewaldii CCALA 016 TaxID=2107694 RepID=A0A2T1M206_9CHRO|nr:class I SAM-dependent methyltransferase [Aphanothece hegewaldii]PSF38665.1 methyltransferase type 11 [Aphanothece hegewaldii CCALA 016]
MIQLQVNSFLTRIADYEETNSWSSQFRGKRFDFFKQLIRTLALPLNILDVGGREAIWQKEFYGSQKEFDDVKVTILNLTKTLVSHPNLKSVVGNATNMKEYQDKQFDVIFSNSVIEHVGNYENQQQMANEIQRVGKRYFVQTPNRYFPIEPHFLFPFYQFFPLWLKVWLISHFDLGWRKKQTDQAEAINIADSVRLLSKKELKQLFPKAKIFEEKFAFFTKSFIVYEGW